MPTRRISVRHVFRGGWATDFGPTVDIDASNIIEVPFLVNAENVFYELDGAPHKIQGLVEVDTTPPFGGDAIRALFDYTKLGTAGSPTQRRLAVAGTSIYRDDGAGNFSAFSNTIVEDAIWDFTVFEDRLVIANDSSTDVPLSWDQSANPIVTLASLGDTPPNFAFSETHKNRLWAAGVDTEPSSLFYSGLLDATDWTGPGSGKIQIDPNDGDRITALASHKNDLFVFKGPNTGSIHRISGSSPTGSDAFGRSIFLKSLGAVNNNTIFRFRDDLGFMAPDGAIHSLAATDAFGDFNEASLSRPINQMFLLDRANHTELAQAQAAVNTNRGQVIFVLPIDASNENNAVVMMDYRFQPVRWAYWTALSGAATAIATVNDSDNFPTIWYGSGDGKVRRKTSQRSIDGTTSIPYRVTWPFFHYGNPENFKQMATASVAIRPTGDSEVTLGWKRDIRNQKTETISQGGASNTLASLSSDVGKFTLDDPVLGLLGGTTFIDRFFPMNEAGEFRSVQYEVTNNVLNEDLEVHSLTVQLKAGADSSENF